MQHEEENGQESQELIPVEQQTLTFYESDWPQLEQWFQTQIQRAQQKKKN